MSLSYSGDSTQQDVATISITIIDDSIPESIRESFEVVGVSAKNIFFPFPAMRVTIIDNDEGKCAEVLSCIVHCYTA